jgi:hypothetical protein
VFKFSVGVGDVLGAGVDKVLETDDVIGVGEDPPTAPEPPHAASTAQQTATGTAPTSQRMGAP